MSVVGPLRVGSFDATIRTDSADFAAAARWAFVDLDRSTARPAVRSVVFDVSCHSRDPLIWSVHRDEHPCELELRDDAVLNQVQWELNRLAIESQSTAIHAGAVVLGGRAALLAGHSHSGKSTLTGWLTLRHGASYLTDEVAAIDDSGYVHPFPRALGVRSDSPLAPDTAHAWGCAAARDVERFTDGERLIPVTASGGMVADAAAPVGVVVFPTYDATCPLTVNELDEADAFERLAALTPGLAQHGGPVFDRLCRIVAEADAWDVRYDDVRDAAPVVVAALTDERSR